MKNLNHIFPFIGILFLCVVGTAAQSQFSPEAYMQFRQDHLDYTGEQLVKDHPPATTYYTTRQVPAELNSIPWYDSLNLHFKFTSDEQKLLKENFFMVTERLSSPTWAGSFIDLYTNDLPLFLSSDFILSTLHNSYDLILQTIEWQFLEPNLKELLHAMYDYYPEVAQGYSDDDRYSDVIKDGDLYISVALSLAEGTEYLPQFDNAEKYNELMEAIDAEKMTSMTLFTKTRTRKVDFSQFTLRGHYTDEIFTGEGMLTLEDYFKTMMWLGRIDFLLTAPPSDGELPWTDEELRRMQLGALLVNETLYGCGKIENLVKHEEIISFMVGPDDNLTPAELMDLSDRKLESNSALFEKEAFDSFKSQLNASDDYGQKIMSNFFYVDPNTSDPDKLPISYKLLGQKFLLDSYVFSEVVFDRIIFEDHKIWRPLPDPLDALAALGNEDALALLEGELEHYKYAANMAGLKYLIESYDDDFWEQSLYNTWLGTIRSLNPPEFSEGLPYFMQTTAWHQEKLNTQLTSWAQLRHDNLLYGKQSYTGGVSCSFPYTYVEPYPEMYGRLADFAFNAAGFFEQVFSNIQVESKERIIQYYEGYEEIMQQLETISLKELEHRALGEAEVTFLKTMISEVMGGCGPPTDVTGWYRDLFFDINKALETDFTVADVHTQPTDEAGNVVGNILHVGTGNINMGIFLVENPCSPGKQMAFAGPVSSFHFEIQPNFKRLNDEEWEEKFMMGSYTERPDWVASYLLDREGNKYEDGRSLKGAVYTGTGITPEYLPNVFDYVILFPNPSSGEAGLRFISNMEGDLKLEVYDSSGRLVYQDMMQNLPVAEHTISLPAHEWKSGIYLVRMVLANKSVVRELLIQ